MRKYLKLLAVTAVLGCSVGLGIRSISAQGHQSVSDLFRELQSSQTTDQAAKQLRELGKSDTVTRQYLADKLPAMIEEGPKRFDARARPYLEVARLPMA